MKLVSIVIPTLNEEKTLEPAVESILSGNYPIDYLEIFIVDGLSTDRTPAIIINLTKKYKQIKYIINPGANKSNAINLASEQATGFYFMRADAHAIYHKNYIKEAVQSLDIDKNVISVGGIRKATSRSNSLFSRTFEFVFQTRIGVGNANYNLEINSSKYVTILFLFFMRTSDFKKIGKFDTRLTRGQDREYNLRIINSGGLLLLNPKMKSLYYCRDSFFKFILWAFVGGKTPFYISKITKTNLISIRNYLPVLMIIYFICTFSLISYSSKFLIMILPFIVYFYPSVTLPIKSFLQRLFLPVILFSYHFSYGIGSLFGIFSTLNNDDCQ
tara:strand:+ start:9196 stop:10182 length:987 start_codon:yes stop_codon:yes gene_type:complete